ncbi:MAG: SGNH/GDSL hydrolase family protein [Nitrospirota bacterium]
MKPTVFKRWTFMGLVALVLLTPSWAAAQTTFGRIVVFGTSLSDPGNAFALGGRVNTPPYDTLGPFLVPEPDMPYARGGHHFSNGATWIEQFAGPLGLAGNVRPAFQGQSAGAANYAVGGARARKYKDYVNLPDQVAAFLRDFNGAAPSDALYVVEIGANDIRDALEALAAGADGGAVIADALTAVGNNIGALYAAGARKFLVWNAPDIRLTPAIRILETITPGAGQAAGFLTQAFNSNSGLGAVLAGLEAGLPGIEIVPFDVYRKLNDVVADPATFGLHEVEEACVTPNLPPFACRTPDEFLFWDGLHPTAAAHAIIAQEAASALGQQ